MAATAVKKLDAGSATTVATVKKMGILAGPVPYEAPKVLSFSVKELSTDNALSMLGNT